MLVLLLLVCMLLTTLTQMASMNNRKEHLQAMVAESLEKEKATEELIEYYKTNAYVIEWAERMGWIKSDDLLWIKEQVNGK